MVDFESESGQIDNRVVQAEGAGFSSEKLILILKKYWFWLPISLLLSSIGAHYYLKYSKPVYQASSSIRLEMQKEASNAGIATIQTMQFENLDGEIELIRSQRVAQEVLDVIDLNVSYFAEGNILTTEIYNSSPFKIHIFSDPKNTIYDKYYSIVFVSKYEFSFNEKDGDKTNSKIYKIGDPIQIGQFKFTIQWTAFRDQDIEGKEFMFRINSRGALISYLLGNLSVVASSVEARTLAISFVDFNREKARDIVNTYDTVYLRQSLEKKQKSHEQTLLFIENQIEETAGKLESYENDLEAFVKQNGSVSPNAELNVIVKQLEDLEKTKEELTRGAKNYSDILVFIQSDASKDNIVPMIFGTENIQIADGINKLNDLYKQRELLKISNKEITLPFRKLELEISIIKSQMLNHLKESKKFINEKTAEINAKISKLSAQFSGLPDKETELNRIKRFSALYEKYYMDLITKQIEYQISKAGTVPEFTILSEAYASEIPISPNKQKVWLLFLLIGILPVTVYIAIKYLLMNVIYSQQQIENILMAPILGSIPTYSKKMTSSTLVVDKNPKSSISESLRSIRTNSDFMLPKKSKQIIGVTSTISGEGKTFFAINYAAILALTGKKVIILDLDMRKPKIHVGFNVDNSIGMSSILSGMNHWKDAVKSSTLSNLHFIPAGPIPPNPNELLLKSEFDELIDQLFLEYDVIMADNPPIGLVTDASAVFRRCDLSIYVVRSGYSKEAVIGNINLLYMSKNYNNLSVVINDVNRKNTYGNKYGYGYGYVYGYGYGYYEEDRDNSKWWHKFNPFKKK
jgi:tyrosine-protein kinase Etk/Wzc